MHDHQGTFGLDLTPIISVTVVAVCVGTRDNSFALVPKEHLDLHLMFPLLEFVENNRELRYDPKDVQRARLDLLKPTNMVDYAIEIYDDLNEGTEEGKEEMEKQKNEVYAKMEMLRSENEELEKFFKDRVRCLACYPHPSLASSRDLLFLAGHRASAAGARATQRGVSRAGAWGMPQANALPSVADALPTAAPV